MKYNHVPDKCFASISGALDKYTSPLFMCYTHLLIAKDTWKDTRITGILVLVTCRKLKSNAIRIYDPSTSRMMFEMELYEGISLNYKFGKRWLMIPFLRCSFCFLFEDDDDLLFCRSRIDEMAASYPDIIPKPAETKKKAGKKKGFDPLISGVKSFYLLKHAGRDLANVQGESVLDVLYKSVAPVTSIKKKDPETPPADPIPISPPDDEREVLRKQCQAQHFTFDEYELGGEAPPLPGIPPSLPLPPTQRLSRTPPPPPVSRSIARDSTLGEIPVSLSGDGSQAERDQLKAGLQNRDFSQWLEDDSTDSPRQEGFSGVGRINYSLGRVSAVGEMSHPLGRFSGVGEMSHPLGRFNDANGVSDLSDSSEGLAGSSELFGKQRGGYVGTVEDEHAQNVVELRRYQQECEWGTERSEELNEGDVYVIDDADRFLKESSEHDFDAGRSSTLTVLPEDSTTSVEEEEEKTMKPLPRKKREYSGRSKESILIMQDIDSLADTTYEDTDEPTPEPTMRLSPHSTLLPPVVSMSSSHYNSLNSNSSNSETSRLSPINDRRQDFFAHPFTQKHHVACHVCNKHSRLKRLRKK